MFVLPEDLLDICNSLPWSCVAQYFQWWYWYEHSSSTSVEEAATTSSASSPTTTASEQQENDAVSMATVATAAATSANTTKMMTFLWTSFFTLLLVLTITEVIFWAVSTILNCFQLPSEGHPPQFWWIRDHIDDEDSHGYPLLTEELDDDDTDSFLSEEDQKARQSRIEAMIEERPWGGILEKHHNNNKDEEGHTRILPAKKEKSKQVTSTITSQGTENMNQDRCAPTNISGCPSLDEGQPPHLRKMDIVCDTIIPLKSVVGCQPRQEVVEKELHYRQCQQRQPPPSFQVEKEIEDQQESCVICLTPYCVSDIVAGSKSHSCQHIFHKSCLILWLQRQSTCPCCRQEWHSLSKSVCSHPSNNRNNETFAESSVRSSFSLFNMNILISTLTAAWPDSTAISTTTTSNTTTMTTRMAPPMTVSETATTSAPT